MVISKSKLCSSKHYTVDVDKKAVVQINLPNYKTFDNVYDAYSNFVHKVLQVTDKVVPIKTRMIKKNSLE